MNTKKIYVDSLSNKISQQSHDKAMRYVFNPPTMVNFFVRVASISATAWATSNQEPYLMGGVLTIQLINLITSSFSTSLLYNTGYVIACWIGI